MSWAIESHGLTKRFKRHVAVDAIDLRVPEGAIYGFLGSNGAGKSTTIRTILGLRRPTSGSIHLFGQPLDHRRRPLIGAMADSPGGAFYDHLSAADNLRVMSGALGIAVDAPGLLDRVGLSGKASQKVGSFSTGMRQRLGIARALIGDPALVILDEPLNGLDPEGIRSMRSLLVELAEGRTMIICSHLLGEVEKVATHIGLLANGKLVHQGPLEALRSGDPVVRVASRSPALPDTVRSAGLSLSPTGDVTLPGDWSIAKLNRLLVEASIDVDALIPRTFDLEEFYHDRVSAA
ncbi:ABC transporter ATP-binding protein [Sphingomicrobium clamense]|uniref:ATP-binding cassette domain-containing protein n=1 Tax=Sphingomicrobium clamense TaxID=2851013 RepID=A0ABS6V6A6_9SPHN|nr:ATP-binding cassette domain-containing protein [Sphingomicrobium sp. B8]MBW0145081.1 ATP-binding cassette domain-containing protein [Sphingomicrobium sp. B8]